MEKDFKKEGSNKNSCKIKEMEHRK
jgi:hypothetical protein